MFVREIGCGLYVHVAGAQPINPESPASKPFHEPYVFNNTILKSICAGMGGCQQIC